MCHQAEIAISRRAALEPSYIHAPGAHSSFVELRFLFLSVTLRLTSTPWCFRNCELLIHILMTPLTFPYFRRTEQLFHFLAPPRQSTLAVLVSLFCSRRYSHNLAIKDFPYLIGLVLDPHYSLPFFPTNEVLCSSFRTTSQPGRCLLLHAFLAALASPVFSQSRSLMTHKQVHVFLSRVVGQKLVTAKRFMYGPASSSDSILPPLTEVRLGVCFL